MLCAAGRAERARGNQVDSCRAGCGLAGRRGASGGEAVRAHGFMPPDQAAGGQLGVDALLMVMSREPDQELFMRTSFTTKFLDYSAYGKPIILWGPP